MATETMRADNLGSFLRPDYLLAAKGGDVDAPDLSAIEDRAIRDVVALQEGVGLDVVTDGEFRRRHFFSTIAAVADGIDPTGFIRHHRDREGNPAEVRTPTPVARLRRVAYLADSEYDFVRSLTRLPIKITMPSPSLLAAYWSPEKSVAAYPSADDYLEHLIELMHEDAVVLAGRGVDQIQLDAPHYAYIQQVLADVADRDATLAKIVEADNRVLRGVPVTKCLHICRGNMRGRFTGTEPYDGFAHAILPTAEYDRFLLEYDDERSGGFEPLRHTPPSATVVLGLITTKRGLLEDDQEIRARIEEASAFVPLDRLALSTQCGFASNELGNEISFDEQQAKLEAVVRIAQDVWGGG